MNYKNFDIVNFERFVAQYMGTDAESFVLQSNALKIYPLSIAPFFIKTPTPLFRAEFNFLLLFLNGGGQQQVDNEMLELQANDILFIREGHLNAIKSIDPGTEGYFIYISEALLPQVFADRMLLNRFTFYPKHSISKSEMAWLQKCCELIYQQKTENGHSTEVQLALLSAIVLKLADASPAALSKPDRQSEVTMLFKELLYENFIGKREVKFYANALAVSEGHLNRCVNHVTNRPPKQHINEVVIFHSKVLLQDRSKSIAEVAFDLNFSNPSHFGKLFKQITHQTPTEYRNALLQNLPA